MFAPLAVVVALTLNAGPALQAALSASPLRFTRFGRARPDGGAKDELLHAEAVDLAAFAASLALGTVARLASRMSLPRRLSFWTSEE